MKQGKHDTDLYSEQAPANRLSGDCEPPAKLIFPSLKTLTTGLQSIFSGNSPSRIPISVLSREPNIYASIFLNIYNAEYFGEWKRQMSEIPNHFKHQFCWLAGMGERCDAFLELLYKAPQTVIHGEFYPSNALIRAGEVYVVDWESVGIGAGEIDLAALTQGPWPEEILQECEAAYRMARWGKSPPLMFGHTFCAAKLYFYYRLLFHWLRFYPDRAGKQVWLFNHMHSMGEKLGLI